MPSLNGRGHYSRACVECGRAVSLQPDGFGHEISTTPRQGLRAVKHTEIHTRLRERLLGQHERDPSVSSH